MDREELEKLIEDKVTKGEMPTGLFDTGLWLVLISIDGEDGDDVIFDWFESPIPISDYLGDDRP